jgi:hypothetical protein
MAREGTVLPNAHANATQNRKYQKLNADVLILITRSAFQSSRIIPKL